MRNQIIFAALLQACFASNAYASDTNMKLCSKAVEKFRVTGNCTEEGKLAVVSKSGLPEDYMASLVESKRRFEQHFSPISAPLILVVESEISEASLQVAHSEAVLLLPWQSLQKQTAGMEGEIRKQIEAQFPNLDVANREAVVKQFLDKFRPRLADGERISATERGTVQHEAAHLWFSAFFAGSNKTLKQGEYGSAAPDWLDEVAAILAENDTLTQNRRAALAKLITNKAELVSLDSVLKIQHPLLKKLDQSVLSKSQGDAGVTVKFNVQKASEKDNQGSSLSTQDYYTICRALADFFIEISNNVMIFESVASHIKDGGTFDLWLTKGKIADVNSRLKLNERWTLWLKSKNAEAAKN